MTAKEKKQHILELAKKAAEKRKQFLAEDYEGNLEVIDLEINEETLDHTFFFKTDDERTFDIFFKNGQAKHARNIALLMEYFISEDSFRAKVVFKSGFINLYLK